MFCFRKIILSKVCYKIVRFYFRAKRDRKMENQSIRESRALFDLCKKGKEIYVFGAGFNCEEYMENFIKNYNVKAIFDNNEGKIGKKLHGLLILAAKEIVNLKKESSIIVISSFVGFEEMKFKVMGYGIKYIFSIYTLDPMVKKNLIKAVDLDKLKQMRNFIPKDKIIEKEIEEMKTVEEIKWVIKNLEKLEFEKRFIKKLEIIADDFYKQNKYLEALDIYWMLKRKGYDCQGFIEMLEDLCTRQEGKTKERYEMNRKKLLDYPYSMMKEYKKYELLEIRTINVGREYIIYDKKEKKVKGKYNFKDKKDEKWFFEDLNAPLILKSENNPWNIRYLWETVRRSEDYGGDNHVYLYYETLEEFCGHLQAMDIQDYLKDEKFVFLFGKKQLEAYYPLNFEKLYGIHYDSMEPQPVRVEEIQRLCIATNVIGAVGFSFFNQVTDGNPYLLTFYLNTLFPHLYEGLFKNRNPRNILKILKDKTLFCKIENQIRTEMISVDDINRFVEFLEKDQDLHILQTTAEILEKYEKPTKAVWLKGFYLSWYKLMCPRANNLRFAPVLYFNPHWFALKNFEFTTGHNVIPYLEDLKEEFSYIKFLFLIREQNAGVGCDFDMHFNCHWKRGQMYYIEAGLKNRIQLLYDIAQLTDCLIKWKDDSQNITIQDYIQCNVAMIRFEDLKLEPKAATMALCEFLDIPWSETLMECTRNSQKIFGEDRGFSIEPIYKKRDEILNGFDYFRLELLSCGIYKNWGYQYRYYNVTGYTKEQILQLFEFPFKMEFIEKNLEGYVPELAQKYRKQFMEMVKSWLNLHWEEYEKQEFIVLIPWLKPRKEYLNSNLFQ